MWVELKGKYLRVKIDLDRCIPSPDPFFSIFTIGEHLIIGACWGGKLDGDESNVYGFFENLLTACYYLLQPENPHVQKITKFGKESVVKDGFELRGDEVVVYQAVERNSVYYACSTGEVVRIYYHNEALEFTDCPEYKDKWKGVVEVPLKEFIEDVLKISREYLEKYAPVIEEIRLRHVKDSPDDYDFLQKFHREVEELYKKKFGLKPDSERSG